MRALLISLCLAASLCAQAQSVLDRADEAFREGNLDRAATLARQVLARDPNALHAHMILGVIAAQKNQWATTTRHFEAVIRIEPSNPYGYFYLGQAKLYQRQWEKAIQYFTRALEFEYPERERLTIELAVAQNEAGHPQQALSLLSKIEPPPDPRLAAQYQATKAFAQAKLGQPAAAIEAIRGALQLDDSVPDYWDLLIGTLIEIDQTPQAPRFDYADRPGVRRGYSDADLIEGLVH